MRSWNFGVILDSSSLKRCSQFTNEELKPVSKSSALFTFPWVRNLPMRSWNKEQRKKLLSLNFCSQFTNEELKLGLQVWSRASKKRFAIYQWGVETVENHLAINRQKYVRNLPMRSWNIEKKGLFVSRIMVRNLPMRSWNLISFFVSF